MKRKRKARKVIRKIPQGFLSFASIVAAAAVNYSVVHSPLVFVCLLILVAHELGHYFVAKRHGGEPSWPFFIPLPFIVIAFTMMAEQLDPEGKMRTAFYGPFTGFLVTILLLALNFVLQFTSNLWIALLMLGEIIFNFIGSDGQKYRAARRAASC